MKNCVNVKGLKCQIIREGDLLENIVVNTVYENTGNGSNLKDKDVIGITESVVARAQGNYATVDEIASEVIRLYGENQEIKLVRPIYSRNRFSIILKGIARAAKKLYIVMPEYDEVGNPRGINRFTGVHIAQYYTDICKSENCDVEVLETEMGSECENVLYCGLHDYNAWQPFDSQNKKFYNLTNFFSDKCEWGLLGSNKANEETLKLFPNKEKAKELCEKIKVMLYQLTGKRVIVCVYGDGCFKDPVGGIWEFADPVTMPAYTDESIIESTPNEIKVKALADDKFKNLNGKELDEAIEMEKENKTGKSTENKMDSQGTTPRLYRDLLASLMDLTSGSGDRCTPIIYITGYFK